jgi:RimJ/RimL family protein N-acetyltransferase/8-oxo-dGTP pyrophosphatase MutT (NUDIX family)
VIRQLTHADVDELVALDADPQVMHFVTGGVPTPRSEIEDVVLPRWLEYYRTGTGTGFFGAADRVTGEFLGWFHLRPGEGHPADEPELGYRLRRSAWGRGLATEGSRALIDHAFRRTDARLVVAETMAVHVASRRVMEKAGMTLVRSFHADWPYPIPGDEFGDVEYAITRAEWERLSLGRREEAVPDFVVAAVVIRDEGGRVLVVRKRGTSRYMLPGGKIEKGETPAQAAVRELHEEVGADLEMTRLVLLGEWTAPAANEPDHVVRGHIFEHPIVPGLSPRAEIDDLLWLHPDDMAGRDDLAPLLVTRVLPALAR